MCGDIEGIILPPNATKIAITLDGIAYNIWIEIRQERIARIFIRAPTPLSELWASHGKRAYKLTSIFKFISALTNITIFPSFYECSMAMALIVRRWADERDKKIPPANPTDLEPVLRIWLADKGFERDENLLRLAEAVGGSLRYSLLVLALSLPRARRKDPCPQRIPRSKVERRFAVPTELLDRVRSIYSELCPARSSGPQQPDPQAIHNESSIISAIDTLKLIEDEECQGGFTTERELEQILGEKESPERPFSFRAGLKLLVGNKYQIIGKYAKRQRFTIQHCTIFFNLEHRLADVNYVWVKAELSPIGERHPQAWATAAQDPDQDPGARLEFRIYQLDEKGVEVWSTYAASDSWETICRANSLVDKFEGSSYIELRAKPRRYIYIDDRYARLKREYPELIPFIGGAYIDNEMKVIPANGPRRGQKLRKRKLSEREEEVNSKRK